MKNFTLILTLSAFFIFDTFSTYCQEIEWQKTIGNNYDDYLRSTSPTSDGGFILGGTSLGDYWIVKVDSVGTIEWQDTIGGSGSEFFWCLKPTPDGGYICGGSSNSGVSGDKTDSCRGDFDYWIVKLDSAGIIQWQKTIGGSMEDDLRYIYPTSDGGYICGGESQSDISGDKTEDTYGFTDYWIIKLDAVGNIQWQNTIQGDDFDAFFSIEQTTDGGYICGGWSYSNSGLDKTENTSGGADYWIIKLDVQGNIQWQNTIGGSSDDAISTIHQTADGGYIIGGTSYSGISGDKTENCYGLDDYWIVKLNASGNIQWQNTIGGNSGDKVSSVYQTLTGDYIVAGTSSSSISVDKTEGTMGGDDYWILKLNSTGSIISQNTIGGASQDELSEIHPTQDGGFIVGGYSNSSISWDKTVAGAGGYDFWILKLTNDFNLITGNIFADLNNNGVKDANEATIINNKVTEANTNRFAFSNQNGFYAASVLSSGNYTVSPASISYYNPVPAIQPASFTGINEVDSLNDFALQPAGVFNDLCITITPIGRFRPGFNGSFIINYQNVGTTTLNGDVIFFLDNNLTYFSSSTNPSSVTNDSITWSTGLLTPFQSASIVVTVQVNSAVPFGTFINSNVRVEPVAGDANPSCNFAASTVLVTGAYDPNDILVSEDTLITSQFPNPPYLDYIIRFQNTGNDTAFTVRILNPIDVNILELSSIEFVNASHPVNLSWIPSVHTMEFKFTNILLPDSNTNEPLSHGFIHYRIKPKTTLLMGDIISNNAYIYFDLNSPVTTNTAITKIVLPTGISDLQITNYNLIVFPNPAKEEMTITGYTLQNSQPAQLKIFDVIGKEVLSQSIANLKSHILNLNSISSGVYYLQLNNGKHTSTARFVKL